MSVFRVVAALGLANGLLFAGAKLLSDFDDGRAEAARGSNLSLEGQRPNEPDLTGIVVDRAAALQLGKALFWDTNVGSFRQACASCHFHAGADIRIGNQVNPGPDGEFGQIGPAPTALRNSGPNATLRVGDFPLRRLARPDDRDSAVVHDNNDRISSQGSFGGILVSQAAEAGHRFQRARAAKCETSLDPANPFHSATRAHRLVEPRQAPSVINAAFNIRQFWDGRANEIFNGFDPFGRRSNDRADAGVFVLEGGTIRREILELRNASLASQALGPPLSDFEMSCQGLRFADIARRLLGKRPLQRQQVSLDDSVLGGLVHTSGKGLNPTYETLIQRAFHRRYWNSPRRFTLDDRGDVVPANDGLTLQEVNFSLFFGVALMTYQQTLVSDRAPIDAGTLSVAAERGKKIFETKGHCINCHGGPVLSNATRTARNPGSPTPVERMPMGDGGTALYDEGFYNIGVRATREDPGLGGRDPYGTPLSYTRQYRDILLGKNVPDRFDVRPCDFEVPFNADGTVAGSCRTEPTDPVVIRRLRDAVDGAFKTPTLRNIGLTPPYMHNGGHATLRQVIDFYNRGGDRRRRGSGDTSGHDRNRSNLDADIRRLDLTETEKADLEAFMLALTDQRVACHAAPFDHPEIILPDGHKGGADSSRLANDRKRRLPAVGRGGLEAIGKPCFPNTGDLFGETQRVFSLIAPAR